MGRFFKSKRSNGSRGRSRFRSRTPGGTRKPRKRAGRVVSPAFSPKGSYKFTFNIEMGITDVWSDIDFYKDRKQRIHPTQKPYELIERIIKASSNENDLVLDPFLGSGITVNVCKKINRYYYGMEKSKEYFDKINIY